MATNAVKKLRNDNVLDNKKCYFQMPVHYPRYTKNDYEQMPELTLDRLLTQYGLPLNGDVDQKRRFAIGAFIWPSQTDQTYRPS